jgi:hypothetical protein
MNGRTVRPTMLDTWIKRPLRRAHPRKHGAVQALHPDDVRVQLVEHLLRGRGLRKPGYRIASIVDDHVERPRLRCVYCGLYGRVARDVNIEDVDRELLRLGEPAQFVGGSAVLSPGIAHRRENGTVADGQREDG